MTRKGFTLVELIVVITILAILATIAFLSFQGYSASARDGKRSADLASVNTKVRVSGINGMALSSLLTSGVGKLTTTGIDFGGYADNAAPLTTKYDGGSVNYTALGLKQSDYQDPKSTNDYKMGVVSVSGDFYELAATMERDGTPEALVLGNFKQRLTTAAYQATISPAHTASNPTFTITSADIGKFRRGDVIAGCNAAGGTTVSKISADGLTITLSANCGAAGVETLTLASAEAAGLVADKTTTTTAVTNASSSAVPY